ncbi:MAG: 23S rRNA (pseudouridine(1915)-N(3))-methyltransferase RlmH [Deltaproteobacteria bacterium]|nr:23S rRNA (pseudouridine(1915)-N(3))-methyltransferase RlmH [Deltaproteobacteria bacterium]
MKIRLIWPGRTREAYLADGISDYTKRISRFLPVEVIEVKAARLAGGGDEAAQVQAEGERLLKAAKDCDYRIILDERGRAMTSPELAGFLSERESSGCKALAFAVGGASGLEPSLPGRAKFVLSLSRMTLTHEMTRLILSEQIYRALTIRAGLPYHK